MAFLLTEDRNEHVSAVYFFLAAGLDVEHGSLKYALESQGRLGFPFGFILGDQRCGRIQKLFELTSELLDICTAGIKHVHRRVVIQQCQEQVLHGHEFMSFLARVFEGQVQRDLEFST